MSPIRAAWGEYAGAARAFSRPARLVLVAAALAWAGRSIQSVLFNLYLASAGFQEAFIGRALGVTGLGLALAALPAGVVADRWGGRRCLMLGAAVEGIGAIARAAAPGPAAILAACALTGAGQSLFAVAAVPFLAEHSSARERTHLLSALVAASLLASVAGNALGGALPAALSQLLPVLAAGSVPAYRAALLAGGACTLAALLPLRRLEPERKRAAAREPVPPDQARRLRPIALNFLLVGCGAGLVIPFMNLYFKSRFGCSSAQIGGYFAIAGLAMAAATLLAPALARRLGTLRAAVATELASIPFLLTLSTEASLTAAVVAYWLRAMLMNAGTPLLNSLVMESLPPVLRARASGVNTLVFNLGWAACAAGAGVLIQRFGWTAPFYLTAALYTTAAVTFYMSFRDAAPGTGGPRPEGFAAGVRPREEW